jgi:hypothetical protein
MTTDVKQAHINLSGFLVLGRTRVKALSYVGTSGAGTLVFFDTASVPVSSGVSYGRTGTLVTVTKSDHGLVTGDVVGIHFEASPSATDGNYVITKVNANSFTLTDINTGSISGGPAAVYVSGGGSWLLTYEASATDIFNNAPEIPEDGVLALKGVYAFMDGIALANIYYG